eukprot:gene540-1033_t
MSLSLLDGDLVIITGLKNRTDLNGEYAEIKGRLDNGRLEVQLIKTRANLSLNPDNAVKVDVNDKAAMEDFLRNHNSKSAVFPLFPNASVILSNNALNFYPMGNSPAKFLLETVPIDAVRANILLLGCGDNRHILYTCSSNLLLNGGQIPLLLDITMCDMEPSIHARNIILLKMIMDNIEMNKIWCLCYATSIDDICLVLLQKYATDLYNIGEGLQAWLASDIDVIIQFTDQRPYTTLREIRKFYAKGRVDSNKQKEIQYKQKIINDFVDKSTIYTAVSRSCNPAGFTALPNMEVHSRIFKQFHKTGMIPTCIYNPPNTNHCTNPMFLREQSQLYDLHCGQDLTLSFHLAQAYAEIKPNSTSTSNISEDDIYKICFDQFQDWCNGFKEYVTQSKIIIRVFTGDAFDLCQLMSDAGRRQETSKYFPIGTTQCISLPDDMPNKFDVIDTSNLRETCGLLNILLTCSFKNFLEKELSCSTNTFATITGLVLSESYSFTTEKLTNSKTKMDHKISLDGSAITFTWRRSLSNMKYSCSSAESFITILLTIFKRIFKIPHALDNIMEMLRKFKKNATKQLTDPNSFAYPSELTFIKLLKCSKKNILGITDAIIEDLFTATTTTGAVIIRSNYYQELLVWCTRLNVISPSVLKRIGDHFSLTLAARLEKI